MKQYFEWIKASERLPEKAGLYHFRTTGGLHDIVFYNEKHGFCKVKSIRKETENKHKPELDIEFIPLKYKIEDMEYLSPASPLPISGDAVGENKEDVKRDAEKVASAFGYKVNSLSLEVINVKDSYCIGRLAGYKAGHQARDGEVEKLVANLQNVTNDLCIKIRQLWPDLDPSKYSVVIDAREALKPYQSPVKETI